MPRGRARRKGREAPSSSAQRQVSQDSTDGPREKETRLSDQSANIFLFKYNTKESDSPTTLPDCSAMELVNEPARDTCDSPTMPLLSPEVPSFGDLPSIEGPPVLTHFSEEDTCDHASDKSEGDSGKENEEEVVGVWRGSRSSLSSRSSRPRSGPFNQLNNANVKVAKPEKKSVLGEANTCGRVTRSTISNLELAPAAQSKGGPASRSSSRGGPTPRSSSLASLETNNRTHESPVKGMKTPSSPMSPHKIQMPDRPTSFANKFKQAISYSPKTFSANNAKQSNLRKTEGAKSSSGKKLGKLAQAAGQHRQITDYFPIRRSERKNKSEIEKNKMEGIEARLLSTDDSDLDLEVREIKLKGRGIVTTRAYEKGEFVLEYSGELIDIGSAKDRESMYSLDTTKGCYMYYFNHKGKQYCIDATQESGRYGRLVNHSCKTPNMVTKVVMLGDMPRLILVAKQNVPKDTELLYDYGDRSKESLKAHPWLAY